MRNLNNVLDLLTLFIVTTLLGQAAYLFVKAQSVIDYIAVIRYNTDIIVYLLTVTVILIATLIRRSKSN